MVFFTNIFSLTGNLQNSSHVFAVFGSAKNNWLQNKTISGQKTQTTPQSTKARNPSINTIITGVGDVKIWKKERHTYWTTGISKDCSVTMWTKMVNCPKSQPKSICRVYSSNDRLTIWSAKNRPIKKSSRAWQNQIGSAEFLIMFESPCPIASGQMHWQAAMLRGTWAKIQPGQFGSVMRSHAERFINPFLRTILVG